VGVTEATGAPDRWLEEARRLDRWMSDRDLAGHDPHDFLASPVVRGATLGNRWVAVAWTQLGKRLPVQLRPLLRVPRLRNAKGVGLVLAARARLATLGIRGLDTAGLVDWLNTAADRGRAGAGWGYPFPWANRDFMAPAGTPSAVATAFVGHGLLDAAEMTGLDRAADLAMEAAPFLAQSLHRIPGPGDTFCFSYTPLDRRAVHNASLLAASLLARLHGRGAGAEPGTGAGESSVEVAGPAADLISRAARFTLSAQRPDGSWPYGVTGRDQWADSFHTGYVLLALEEIGQHVEVPGLTGAVDRGVDYWRVAFFSGPAVGFHPGEAYPVDTHAVAQAILTFLGLRDRVPGAMAEAVRLGEWVMAEMRDPEGFYYYQHHGWWRNRLPYLRWTQAWMLRALAELAVHASADARQGAGSGRAPGDETGAGDQPGRPGGSGTGS
jgi:hypothetical protein